ncbi:MAG: hypothetical protein IKW36_03000 [Alistipes sp.]|nr:hypothetical protein [Alistipes sp.]
MEDNYFICVSIYIILALAVIIFLYLWLGKKRNEVVLDELRKVLSGINTISGSVTNNERQAVSRDNSLRSLISRNQQKLENSISQSSKSNEGRIEYMEERVTNEIQNATELIKSSVHQSHAGLSKSFKTKLSEVNAELADIHQSLREFKDEILRTQAQSFYGIEAKYSNISNEERAYLEKQFRAVHNEHTTLDKSIQDVALVMRTHLDSLKPLEELFGRLNTLYNKLLSLEKDILTQEKSLNGMVEKHVKISEYTQELQKTSKDIFDLMKLMLMDSVVQRTTPHKR